MELENRVRVLENVYVGVLAEAVKWFSKEECMYGLSKHDFTLRIGLL